MLVLKTQSSVSLGLVLVISELKIEDGGGRRRGTESMFCVILQSRSRVASTLLPVPPSSSSPVVDLTLPIKVDPTAQ